MSQSRGTRRPTYNEVASGGQATEIKESTNCAAHGCPLSAGIIVGGRRTCAVHLETGNPQEADRATAEIRKRMPLVEVIRILRAPPDGMTDAEAVLRAINLSADLEGGSRYEVLARAEGILLRAAREANNVRVYRPDQPRQIPRLTDAIKRMPT